MAYFLSRKNRFLVWPPGIWPRWFRDCSTVNNGGCFTVECATPRLSSAAKSWSGVAGIAGNNPVGSVLVSQRTEEVKDDAHPGDRGTRHCRHVIKCRRDASR